MILTRKWQKNFRKAVANWDKRELTDAGLSSDEEMNEAMNKNEGSDYEELQNDEEMEQEEEKEEEDAESTSQRTSFEIRRDQNRAEHDALFRGFLSTPSLPTPNSARRRRNPKSPTPASRVSKRQIERKKKGKEQSLAASYLAAATANKKGGNGNGFSDIGFAPQKGGSMN